METRVLRAALATLVLLSGSAAAGGAQEGEAGAGAGKVPQVGERYQETIEKAWAMAVAGEVPTNTCAGVKGSVIGSKDQSAQALRALLACDVDIPVRYFEAYLDMVQAGDKTCIDFMTQMMTQLPAMTMSTDAIWETFEKVATSGDAEAQELAAEALTEVAMDATADKGANDPKRIIKKRLTDRVQEICPEVARVVLN